MQDFKPDTLCIHAGYTPKNGEPRVAPIVQSTTYVYESSKEMGDLFDLQAEGFFYTRLANPTLDAVEKKIAALLAEQFSVDADSITMDTSFEELGADSLDIVELSMALEEEFGVEEMQEDDLSGIATVADLVNYLKGKLEED